jgi:hypothetical protein
MLSLSAGIRHTRNAWHRIWPVLWKAWPVLLGVAGPVVALFLGWLCSSNRSDQIRFAGTALQFFGLLLVWMGISDARRTFKLPPVFASIAEWLRSLLSSLRPQNQTIIVGSASIGLSGVSALAAIGTVKGGETLEQRIDRLEQALERLRQSGEARATRIEATIGTVRTELREQTEQMVSAHNDLRRQLEDLAVGDSHLQIVGFWWLLLATFATSIPDVIAKWF